jgi:hypothetical protein
MPAVRVTVGLLAVIGASLRPAAGQEAAAVPLAERSRSAERIVVGQVAAVSPTWQVNDFGDRLIVSLVRVAVSETLKGQPQTTVDVEIEGGTIDGLTLHVSDQATVVPGERAVFYLTRNARGRLVPHLRGQGLLKLDRSDRVPGTSLTLEMIRREAAAGAAR